MRQLHSAPQRLVTHRTIKDIRRFFPNPKQVINGAIDVLFGQYRFNIALGIW